MSKASHFARSIFNGQADVFFALTIITIVALLIMPIPTFLIDILISTNISLALIILLIAIYIPNTLKLSTFPTILLLTTMFRLGLNVATSRLILLHANAGEVVSAFGNTVVSGNLVVGIVIFLLLMFINMIVVAKGSERVAEVAARFTLDAMPGKQMSIDADLRSGILDMEQAKNKRSILARESQLFGAMDGAMKFVKGDVIAGIIIFIINIVAGLIIGKIDHGMDLDEALSTYAILSVGDGLVSIIPGLLMSVCAGLIVTRVDSDVSNKNLSVDILEQILSYPKALFIAAFFILVLAILPGLPGIPFGILSLIVLLLGIYSQQQQKGATERKSGFSFSLDNNNIEDEGIKAQRNREIVPISIEVHENLISFVDDSSNFVTEFIPLMKNTLEKELGVEFPSIRVSASENHDLKPSQYLFLLNEIPIEGGVADYEECKKAGFIDAKEKILIHLSEILRKNASLFISLHEAQVMLDNLEKQFPSLVKELIPKVLSLFQFTDVLKRLLSEDVPIRDLKAILQALAEYALVEQNPILLTELVRVSISRILCHRFGEGQRTLLIYLFSSEIEEIIRSSIEMDGNSSYLAMEPKLSKEILQAIKDEIRERPISNKRTIILTRKDIRRLAKKLIELEFPDIVVMSYQEIHADYQVQPIGRIGFFQHNLSNNDEEEHEFKPLASGP